LPELSAIREGIKTNLDAIPGWHISAYMLSNPTPPAIHVFPDEIQYDKAMGRGHDDWWFIVQGFVGMPSDIGAQQRLDTLLASTGAASLKENVESDCTLGGIVDDLRVETTTGYRVYPRPQAEPVLGAEWRVYVMG
jgi:hypothetical protein